jgi:hypothetical protein
VLNAAGSGSETAIVNGIRWCADNGAHVINMSLGGIRYRGTTSFISSPITYGAAIDYALNLGTVVVTAARSVQHSSAQQRRSWRNSVHDDTLRCRFTGNMGPMPVRIVNARFGRDEIRSQCNFPGQFLMLIVNAGVHDADVRADSTVGDRPGVVGLHGLHIPLNVAGIPRSRFGAWHGGDLFRWSRVASKDRIDRYIKSGFDVARASASEYFRIRHAVDNEHVKGWNRVNDATPRRAQDTGRNRRITIEAKQVATGLNGPWSARLRTIWRGVERDNGRPIAACVGKQHTADHREHHCMSHRQSRTED